MEKIMVKLLELEDTRECIEKCQMKLREQMVIADRDEYLEKEMIYQKNKEELKEVNKNIETLNNALDILKDIKV